MVIAITEPFGYSILEWTVIAGLLLIVVDRLLERFGLSASSKLLREENADLLRRNGELDKAVETWQVKVRELEREVVKLTAQVEELQKHNLEAVLKSLDKHEAQASDRHATTLSVLRDIRDSLKGGVA